MAKKMLNTGPSTKINLERERIKKRYGTVTSEDEEHLQKMHSLQEGDIPLGHSARMQKSVRGLRKIFRPFDR